MVRCNDEVDVIRIIVDLVNKEFVLWDVEVVYMVFECFYKFVEELDKKI